MICRLCGQIIVNLKPETTLSGMVARKVSCENSSGNCNFLTYFDETTFGDFILLHSAIPVSSFTVHVVIVNTK